MIIDNVYCYNHKDFFLNIFNIHSQYKCEDLENIIELVNGEFDTKSGCICYMDVFDMFQKINTPSQYLNHNIEKFFPLHEKIYLHDKLESYYIYSDDKKEKVLLLFFFTQNFHSKIFFYSNNPLKTVEKVFKHVNAMIHCDIIFHIPRLFSMDNFQFLHNSPPYFFINTKENMVYDLPKGEVLGIDSNHSLNNKYCTFQRNILKNDTYGNCVSIDLYHINNRYFYNYLKLSSVPVYIYYLISNDYYFMAI